MGATAAEAGLSVLLLDEQPRAGGQISRDVERAAGPRGAIEERFRVAFSREGQATAPHLLLATGALERPMPLPG